MDYQKHYFLLTERAKTRHLDGYVERHHIVPRCMGGTNETTNIVDLTPEEHFLAHQLLVKIYPEVGKLVLAALMMTTDKTGKRLNNKLFGWLRKRMSSTISKMNKANAATRCKKSGETQRGKKLSEEHRAKLALANKKRKHSPETKAKQRAAALARSDEEKQARNQVKQTPEYREAMRKQSANKVWMFHQTEGTSFTKKEDVPAKLATGWSFGRRAH